VTEPKEPDEIAREILHFMLEGEDTRSDYMKKLNPDRLVPGSFGKRLKEMNDYDEQINAGQLFVALDAIARGNQPTEDEMKYIANATAPLGILDQIAATDAVLAKSSPDKENRMGLLDSSHKTDALKPLFVELAEALKQKKPPGRGAA